MREPEFIGGDVDLRINIYRGQNETNSATNNAKINANGTKNGANGIGSSTPKEREQVKKTAGSDRRKSICNAGILCRTDWSIKKNSLQDFLFLCRKKVLSCRLERNESRIGLSRSSRGSMDVEKIIQELERRDTDGMERRKNALPLGKSEE